MDNSVKTSIRNFFDMKSVVQKEVSLLLDPINNFKSAIHYCKDNGRSN